MGFSVPIDRWLRGPLRAWAESLLVRDGSPERICSTARAIAPRLERSAGRPAAAPATAVWAVVMFQAWRARWQS